MICFVKYVMIVDIRSKLDGDEVSWLMNLMMIVDGCVC